jgi:hypothetical protein
LRSARDRFNGFGDFGLCRVTTQGKPDWDAYTNRRAHDSCHRFIHIARRDENHGESMILSFLAQSQDIYLCGVRTEHRVVYKFRQIPFSHNRHLKNYCGTVKIQWPAHLGQQKNRVQDAQKGQISHPPTPGGYFTRPPRVCQDSLSPKDAPYPKQDHSELALTNGWLG